MDENNAFAAGRRNGKTRQTFQAVKEAFQGEEMTCVCCGRTVMSDPNVESQWTLVVVDGRKFYVCPNELPPNGATSAQYARAYAKVIRRIVRVIARSS